MAIISLQSAASALSALNTAMDVTSNNLANISTAGFKSSRANFQDLLYIEQQQPGIRNSNNDQRPTGLYVGLGTKVSGTQLDLKQGPPVSTSNPLDLMIEGNGLFRVGVQNSLGPGGYAYTRAGQFTVNSDGEIVMASDTGRRLDPTITIPAGVTSVSVDSSGQVYVQLPSASEPQLIGQISLTNFINPTGLKSVGENLYVETGASGPPIEGKPTDDGFGQIRSGMYEASNVDPTTELVNLIRIQRAFEMNSNSIRAADQALQTVAQLHR
jgi:flagellar basal-body rod protein FlgG